MEVLKDMFPTMSDGALELAMADCGGNLEAGMNYNDYYLLKHHMIELLL